MVLRSVRAVVVIIVVAIEHSSVGIFFESETFFALVSTFVGS